MSRGLIPLLGVERTINAVLFINFMGTLSYISQYFVPCDAFHIFATNRCKPDCTTPQWCEGLWVVVNPNNKNTGIFFSILWESRIGYGTDIEIGLRDEGIGFSSTIGTAVLNLDEIDFEEVSKRIKGSKASPDRE